MSQNAGAPRPFTEGGPPDPIAYLRSISSTGHDVSDDEIRRTDSADDIMALEKRHDQEVTMEERRARRNNNNRHQDPPARERPAVGESWPYRESLSFTRSLIFYGAGAVTHEHERACAEIQESRKLRQK
eukprot:scaffold25667_cov103-Cylindrotheca_fusiformis.AAC.2